jgi:N-carbamoyl-L-amino-acid hydrolase
VPIKSNAGIAEELERLSAPLVRYQASRVRLSCPDADCANHGKSVAEHRGLYHRGPCQVRVTELVNAPSLEFPAAMRDRIRRLAGDLRLPFLDLPSLAGHDARQMHQVAPSGMIFIPCRGGVSHNEVEWAEPAHLAAGARVLAELLAELAHAE